jgi:hypothetical protein
MDGCITKASGGGELTGPSPVDQRKQGMNDSGKTRTQTAS